MKYRSEQKMPDTLKINSERSPLCEKWQLNAAEEHNYSEGKCNNISIGFKQFLIPTTNEFHMKNFYRKYGRQNVVHLLKILKDSCQHYRQIEDLDKAMQISHTIHFLQEEDKKYQFLQAQYLLDNITALVNAEKCRQVEETCQFWDNHLKQLIERCQSIEQAMYKQQKVQMNQIEVRIKNGASKEDISQRICKHSIKVSQLSTQLKKLIKTQRYEEAIKVRDKLEKQIKIQVKQNQDYQKVKSRRIASNVSQKHRKDQQALRARLTMLLNQQLCKRNKEMQWLQKRHKNINSYFLIWKQLTIKKNENCQNSRKQNSEDRTEENFDQQQKYLMM